MRDLSAQRVSFRRDCPARRRFSSAQEVEDGSTCGMTEKTDIAAPPRTRSESACLLPLASETVCCALIVCSPLKALGRKRNHSPQTTATHRKRAGERRRLHSGYLARHSRMVRPGDHLIMRGASEGAPAEDACDNAERGE